MEKLMLITGVIVALSLLFYLVEIVMNWLVDKIFQWIFSSNTEEPHQEPEITTSYSPKDIQTAQILQRKHQINQAFLRTQRTLLDELQRSRKS